MESADKITQVKRLIEASFQTLSQARSLLLELTGDSDESAGGVDHTRKAADAGSISSTSEGVRIIEGVFDGQSMVGPDGKQYSVPANYASKSKLVEGDLMKLTIDRTGSFIYKQIGPVERDRRSGVLTQDPDTDEYKVLADGKMYRVLLASVTYFKGEPGDEVVILLPKDKESEWAAVENIIKELGSGGPRPQMTAPASINVSQTAAPLVQKQEVQSQSDELFTDTAPAQPSVSVSPQPSHDDEFEKI